MLHLLLPLLLRVLSSHGGNYTTQYLCRSALTQISSIRAGCGQYQIEKPKGATLTSRSDRNTRVTQGGSQNELWHGDKDSLRWDITMIIWTCLKQLVGGQLGIACEYLHHAQCSPQMLIRWHMSSPFAHTDNVDLRARLRKDGRGRWTGWEGAPIGNKITKGWYCHSYTIDFISMLTMHTYNHRYGYAHIILNFGSSLLLHLQLRLWWLELR